MSQSLKTNLISSVVIGTGGDHTSRKALLLPCYEILLVFFCHLRLQYNSNFKLKELINTPQSKYQSTDQPLSGLNIFSCWPRRHRSLIRVNVSCSLVKAIGWSRFWPKHRTRRQEGKYSAPLYVQESGCRGSCVAGIGTIVAAVPTQAAAAGHPLPQIVLADHADLPAAAALQVEDPLRLNHAHSSARSGF